MRAPSLHGFYHRGQAAEGALSALSARRREWPRCGHLGQMHRDRNAPQARLAQRQPRRLPGYMLAVRLVRRRDQADFYAGEFWASAEFNSATHSTSCVGGGMEDLLLRPLTAEYRADAARRGGCGAASENLGALAQGPIALARLLDRRVRPAGGDAVFADQSYARVSSTIWIKLSGRSRPGTFSSTGRHFRLGERLVVICRRNEGENRFLHHRAAAGRSGPRGRWGPCDSLRRGERVGKTCFAPLRRPQCARDRMHRRGSVRCIREGRATDAHDHGRPGAGRRSQQSEFPGDGMNRATTGELVGVSKIVRRRRGEHRRRE